MTTEYEYTLHVNGAITREEIGPPRAFFIMNRYDWSKKNQCYTDSAEAALVFMLGRQLSEYILYVNDRIYDWPKDPTTVESHLKYCREMDDTFYPPDEFPRAHWWV
jgi:hypothetical protein